MSEESVVIDMALLRKVAVSPDSGAQGEAMATALDELGEDDAVSFQVFVQARFERFFQEEVTTAMKPMMTVLQLGALLLQLHSHCPVGNALLQLKMQLHTAG